MHTNLPADLRGSRSGGSSPLVETPLALSPATTMGYFSSLAVYTSDSV